MPRNPCTYLPRRLQIVASLTAIVTFCILFLASTPSSSPTSQYLATVPYVPQIQEGAQHAIEHLPKLPNAPNWVNGILYGAAHKPPPEQANSTSGDARWYTDFKWRNPFSSSVTLDEDRAVLPPLPERARVYTYFDSTSKDQKTKDAEQELLQIWRRAWWAHGFRPIVLGKPEAMNHPLYRSLQTLLAGEVEGITKEMEQEVMRWLAWANMGSGILANWLAVPMAPREGDPLLDFLRRGEYPSLTRYEGLENGLFVGGKGDIEAAIKEALASPAVHSVKSVAEAVGKETFTIDPEHGGVASYSSTAIAEKYKVVQTKLADPKTVGDGLALLAPLINAHLHTTWQNSFSSGIAVLKPLPEHTTTLIEPAIDIARNLSQCPETPIPASCPPNRPRCKPCVSSTQMLLTSPAVLRNTSTLFTIATVPHPYTLTSLLHARDTLDLKFIRRNTDRDSWVLSSTKELLGTGLSSFSRLPPLKDLIAAGGSTGRTLWLVAETPPRADSDLDLEALDWDFGFALPRSGHAMNTGKSETPVPGPERRPAPPPELGDVATKPLTEVELMKERSLLERAKIFLRRSGNAPGMVHKGEVARWVGTRDVVEAWNLADTEVWKFVRAFNARQRLERRGWEEEEEDFAGGRRHGGIWARWRDGVF